MINKVELENFGPLNHVKWPNLGRINLIIGGNDSGKTFLLKAMYSAIRVLEEYKRGENQRSSSDILAEKLYWTYQPDKIGDLVSKGSCGNLVFKMEVDQNGFCYSFGKDTTKQISSLENHVLPRTSNSVFLPAKEVLSLLNIIIQSREQDKAFGFDDTYLDLARALRQSPKGGKNYAEFAKARRSLESILGGKVEYDEESNRWRFKKGNQRFLMGNTAEGIKKISILDTLLSNRYIDMESVVFFDEPESALHPAAISKLLDIIYGLSTKGIQFFLASHSYFVVKKLYLIAQKNKMSIPIISTLDGQWNAADLLDGIPENSIINESIKLYKEEVGFAADGNLGNH
jgi:AAA15 family ATPase/GTPase